MSEDRTGELQAVQRFVDGVAALGQYGCIRPLDLRKRVAEHSEFSGAIISIAGRAGLAGQGVYRPRDLDA